MTDALRARLQEMTDQEFELLYGRVAATEPRQALDMLDGLEVPWWIVGGRAIEAFTRTRRRHHDLDVAVFARDVPQLVDHLAPHHHVWAVGSGMLQPYLSSAQPLPEWAGQLWIRTDAGGPWLLDFNIAPDHDGRWVFKRDPTVTLDLDRLVWKGEDGIRYQRPEIVLAFKALEARPQDDLDFEAALPRLDHPSKLWLKEMLKRLYPDHRWLGRLDAD